MKKDRLRDDREEIHKLEDIITARSEGNSHFADDIDSLETDVELPDDVDVDEALTFPHPKHKHSEAEGIELMGTPNEDEQQEDWESQDVQPTDYAESYDELTRLEATDNEDELIEDQVSRMGDVYVEQVANERPVDVMPDKFSPDKENDEFEPKNP